MRVAPDRRGAILATVLAMVVASACGSGSSGPKVDAQTLLRDAKATVDASRSAHFTLTSHGVSGGGTTITGADGDIARPDQLKGSLKVSIDGLGATVQVVAKAGVFEALLPFQSHYSRTNPSNYGLDDPTQLLDPVHGLSSLLIIAKDPQFTGQERLGGELLDEVTATVPGSSIPVLPDANPSRPVAMVVAIDPRSDQIRQMVLTGPFTSAANNSVFVVTLSKYGEPVTITLPPT